MSQCKERMTFFASVNEWVSIISDLNFSKHFSNIIRSAIGQIRSIAKFRSFRSVMHKLSFMLLSVVCSNVDYCNSLFAGLPQKSIQLVQNTPLGLSTFPLFLPHCTGYLWCSEVISKLYYLFLNHWAALHILRLLSFSPVTPLLATLRSADQLLSSVRRARLETVGSRACKGPTKQFWSNLPLGIRQASSVSSFQSSYL